VKNELLAFGLDYKDSQKTTVNSTYQIRLKLNPLPWAKKEIDGIGEHMNQQVYFNDLATEGNFKKHAEGYKILHLAMHTYVSPNTNARTQLVFNTEKNSDEDGFLNIDEIYNLRLNADLTVLSACKTGDGILQTGEGVMSLARSFLYAGCPSIIMTLWSVEDQSSAKLVTSFYKNLTEGISTSRALQQAKLEHLQNANRLSSHPFFWAAYVNIGEPSVIIKSNKYLIELFFLAAAILILFIILKWRKLFSKESTKSFSN